MLTKNIDTKIPLKKQQFYQLSLQDEANDLGISHCVRRAHAEWSEIDGQVMWDQREVEYFWIQAQAKERYEDRKRALAERGFIYSDMGSL